MNEPVFGKPTLPTFAPATLSEILRRTLVIYRANFLPFIGLAAAVIVPLTILSFELTQPFSQAISRAAVSNLNDASAALMSDLQASFLPILLISSILGLIQIVLVSGIVTYMTSEAIFGRRLTVMQAFAEIQHKLRTLGLGYALFFVMLFVLGIVAGITLACLIGIAIFGLIAYVGINVGAFLSATIVLENVTATQGINRSWGLAKTHFWRVFGLVVLVAIFTLIVTLIVGVIEQILVPAPDSILAAAQARQTQVINVVFTTITTILIAPIQYIAMTLLYYDIRTRLENLPGQLAAVNKPNPRVSDLVSPAFKTTITGVDVRNIIVLIIGAVVLSVIFASAMQSVIESVAPGFRGF
jgi:hypothetical protein